MMNERRLIPCLYLYKGQAVSGWDRQALFASGDVKELVLYYSNQGADGLLIYDLSAGDAAHEEAIGKIKKICELSEIPVTAAGSIRRMEDVKKLIYAGCAKAVLNFDREDNRAILEEVSARFGREKILIRISDPEQFLGDRERIERYACGILADEELTEKLVKNSHIPITIHTRSEDERGVMAVLKNPVSVTGPYVSRRDVDLSVFKDACKESGIPVRIYQSRIPWNEFKLNSDGMIPVIVQDYKTDEVLMLAYMNDEAYEATIRTGKMTYWSRSRDALWVKGQTSGHFQYVKSLSLDCDNDTILAKVDQVGAACHTGNRSCFFQELIKKDYDDTNPLRVFQDVFNVILDRKVHPREGSYTNYLFDKGIDKILKKVGEECTEIVIAAKNPDKEEIKYEISDFLYHVMVLMAEKGVTWEDITEELARR